jgi:CheY-like chemotaxis protein
MDSDLVVRVVLRRILENAGYDVIEASSGAEVRDSLSSGQDPDLVVADLTMPDAAGLDAVDRLRRRQPRTRVIATYTGTEAAAEEYPSLARSFGADCTLAKPFSSGVFLQRLTDLLAEARS